MVKGTREEQNRRLLAAVEAAKKWDRDDELRWRYATDHERNVALMEILRLGERITRSRDFVPAKDDERFPGLPRKRAS